ncbi:MAG: L-histidine N(alpha)-methyltransferase [Nitrospirales bacterium]|nr:L-histidine N(alpha)-methyltransferase [Nitrospira sp.]MDR4501537.1 L-histidine N(alpha)-methyltransferase [Nitrospirales bacterium]
MTGLPKIIVDVHISGETPHNIKSELRQGLSASPRTLPTKYLYDDRGSELFEDICNLPEYYQTRTERALLNTCADQIISLTNAEELVELGSGAATKTRVLLDAMEKANQLRFYVPFDVSEGIVRRVAQELVDEYEGLHVHGVVGDFLSHLEHIPEGGRRLVVILGGTIGNLNPQAALNFVSSIQREMASGDFFLLGVQLETNIVRIERAYNDSAGVTAEFNKNILYVMQGMVGATLDPDTFDHVALYDSTNHRIEMRLRSKEQQHIHMPSIDFSFTLEKGEDILTEISTKYDHSRTEALLRQSGFDMIKWYTDPEELIGLALARKP